MNAVVKPPERVGLGEQPLPSLVRPVTLGDALDAVAAGCTPYRGGTVFFGAFEGWQPHPPALVDLKRVTELHGVARQDGQLVVAAATPLQVLLDHPLVARDLPIIAKVSATIGNVRVRSAGSIGGNLCAGERTSDLLTLLIALEARLVLQRADGERRITVEEFFLSHRQVDLRGGELLTHIQVPAPHEVTAAYRKVQLTGRPSIAVAAVVRASRTGLQRVVIGAAGSRPQALDLPLGQEPVAALTHGLEYVADHAVGADYKRDTTSIVLQRTLRDLAAALPLREPGRC